MKYIKSFINESVTENTVEDISIWEKYGDNLPDIFKQTIYRIPTKDELIQFENFNLKYTDILQGFGYTIVGRGIKSNETKNTIKTSIKILCDLFPNNREYSKAYKSLS